MKLLFHSVETKVSLGLIQYFLQNDCSLSIYVDYFFFSKKLGVNLF